MKTSFLKEKDIEEVVNSWNPQLMVIGAITNPKTKTIKLIYGDLSIITVPFDEFRPSGDGTKANFRDVEVIDFGHTLRLGKYEAAVDSFDHLHGWAHKKYRSGVSQTVKRFKGS